MRRLAQCLWIIATAAVLMVSGATVALAQSYPGGGQTPPAVRGEKFFRDPIPRTGSDVLMFVMIALLAVVAGIALRRITRRAAHSDS